MKKSTILFALACITFISCHHHGDISISYNDGGRYYQMNADFNRSQTRALEKYMDSRIGRRSNMSFVNSRIDGQLGLDDHTTFYIVKYPGHLKIKLDKDENTDEAYERIREMCEGMKDILTGTQ